MSLKEYMEGIDFQLAQLHILHGAEFAQQLEKITLRKEFVLIPGETFCPQPFVGVDRTDQPCFA